MKTKLFLLLLTLFSISFSSFGTQVTFEVVVPNTTYECWLVGNFNSWNNNEFKMNKIDPNHFRIALDDSLFNRESMLLEGANGAIKYKYCCKGGDWGYVEKGSTGDEILNRDYLGPNYVDTVRSWASLFVPEDIEESILPSYLPSNGLIAWYPFNGNANDESGNGNDGVINGAILTTDRHEELKKAFEFNDINQNDIQLPTNLGVFGVNSFTISVWFKTSSTNASSIIRFDDGYGKEGWGIQIDNGKVIGLEYSNSAIVELTGLGFNDNTWHQVVFTRDVVNMNKILYVDGKIVSSISFNSTNNIIGSGYQLKIGSGAGWFEFFNGKIDDIGLWNRALTPKEIQSLYLADERKITSDTINIAAGKQFEIKLNTFNINSIDSINSYQFTLKYDTTKVEYLTVNQTGTMSLNGIVNVNSNNKGELKIGYMSNDYLSGDSTLLKLKFKAINAGPVHLEMPLFYYNNDTIHNISLSPINIFTKYGDVNGDDLILSHDAGIVLQYSTGLDPIPSLDVLPWSDWRKVAGDVDGNASLDSYDAGIILQKSIDLINIFPVENVNSSMQKAPTVNSGDVIISKEWENIVIRSKGNLIGFNLNIPNGNRFLGTPTSFAPNFINAKNINELNYKIGIATATPLPDNSVLMVIPVTRTSADDLVFDMKVNSISKIIQMKVVTSNSDILNQISLYPNPTKDFINISGIENGSIKITDLNGRILLNVKLNGEDKIDIRNLTQGVYLYRIQSPEGFQNGKIIKE